MYSSNRHTAVHSCILPGAIHFRQPCLLRRPHCLIPCLQLAFPGLLPPDQPQTCSLLPFCGPALRVLTVAAALCSQHCVRATPLDQEPCLQKAPRRAPPPTPHPTPGSLRPLGKLGPYRQPLGGQAGRSEGGHRLSEERAGLPFRASHCQ